MKIIAGDLFTFLFLIIVVFGFYLAGPIAAVALSAVGKIMSSPPAVRAGFYTHLCSLPSRYLTGFPVTNNYR